MKGSAMRRSLLMEDERRDLTLSDVAPVVQPATATSAPRFTGTAAVFDVRTAIGNPATFGFYESIAPGSFTKTLGEADARFLIDHSPYHVVSRASAGTLDLSQNARGLLTDSVLDDDLSYVRDLVANLRNGNIRGMSFGFQVIKDDWVTEQRTAGDGETSDVEVRTIREVKLIEVSAVTFPAYEETDAGLRHSLVPALRHRGDMDAIARAAAARPELAPLLGYDADRQPVHIDLGRALSITPGPPLADADLGAGVPEQDEENEGENLSSIPAHSTATTTETWNPVLHVGRLPASSTAYRAMHAAVDPIGDPQSLQSYSFPHHMVSEDGTVGAANMPACMTGIAALNSMRAASPGGMSHDTRRGVYSHLARHLHDGGKSAPSLKPLPDEPAVTTHYSANIPVEHAACTCGAAVEPEPAASTRLAPTSAQVAGTRMRALAARYGLPTT